VSETALMLRMGNNGKKKMRDFVIISCKVFTVTEKYDIAYILVNYQYILESLLMAFTLPKFNLQYDTAYLNAFTFFVLKPNITWLFM